MKSEKQSRPENPESPDRQLEIKRRVQGMRKGYQFEWERYRFDLFLKI